MITPASKPYRLNENGQYECSECGALLGRIYNIHNDGLYTLQCPEYREHCYRKNWVTEIEASAYPEIKYIERCPICNAVLVHTPDFYLVCPKNSTHIESPTKITEYQVAKLGYLPKNEL